jgi:hypothetical protein
MRDATSHYTIVCVCVWKVERDAILVTSTTGAAGGGHGDPGLGLSWPHHRQCQSLLCGSWHGRERGKPIRCVFLHVAVPHVVWVCVTTDRRLRDCH